MDDGPNRPGKRESLWEMIFRLLSSTLGFQKALAYFLGKEKQLELKEEQLKEKEKVGKEEAKEQIVEQDKANIDKREDVRLKAKKGDEQASQREQEEKAAEEDRKKREENDKILAKQKKEEEKAQRLQVAREEVKEELVKEYMVKYKLSGRDARAKVDELYGRISEEKSKARAGGRVGRARRRASSYAPSFTNPLVYTPFYSHEAKMRVRQRKADEHDKRVEHREHEKIKRREKEKAKDLERQERRPRPRM